MPRRRRWYWNLRALGQPEARFHPARAMVSWFIPIFNWWRPKQIANDVWRGSDPDAPAIAADAWKNVPVPALLGWWWAAWIVFSHFSNYVGRLWWEAGSIESIRTAAKVDIASSGLELLTGVLAIAVVRKLTARQLQRARRIASQPPVDEQ